jgi:hypothetical protein
LVLKWIQGQEFLVGAGIGSYRKWRKYYITQSILRKPLEY